MCHFGLPCNLAVAAVRVDSAGRNNDEIVRWRRWCVIAARKLHRPQLMRQLNGKLRAGALAGRWFVGAEEKVE
eukprot:scaffold454_cov124-Isochrysis_galbana.AAC.27